MTAAPADRIAAVTFGLSRASTVAASLGFVTYILRRSPSDAAGYPLLGGDSCQQVKQARILTHRAL